MHCLENMSYHRVVSFVPLIIFYAHEHFNDNLYFYNRNNVFQEIGPDDHSTFF